MVMIVLPIRTIGLLRILGVPAGVKKVTSELRETLLLDQVNAEFLSLVHTQPFESNKVICKMSMVIEIELKFQNFIFNLKVTRFNIKVI
jgi:hypothetical protein